MSDERDRAQAPGLEDAVAQRSHDLLSSVPRPAGAGSSESVVTVLVALTANLLAHHRLPQVRRAG